MGQLQLIYDDVAEKKLEERDLNELYKSALENMDEYVELEEQIKELREKKKQIELKAQAQLGRAWEKLEDIKQDVKAERERMTDVAINDLMSGVTVEVEDKFANKYMPVWSVKFKKKQ